jgi:hypothetical protein
MLVSAASSGYRWALVHAVYFCAEGGEAKLVLVALVEH